MADDPNIFTRDDYAQVVDYWIKAQRKADRYRLALERIDLGIEDAREVAREALWEPRTRSRPTQTAADEAVRDLVRKHVDKWSEEEDEDQ